MKQHVFFNAGSETAAEQTELIIDVVKVIANVLPNLWTSARRDEKPREAGREMHAEACILEQSLLSRMFLPRRDLGDTNNSNKVLDIIFIGMWFFKILQKFTV